MEPSFDVMNVDACLIILKSVAPTWINKMVICIKSPVFQLLIEGVMRFFTFGNVRDVGVSNSNVRDPFQVNKSTGLDSCAPQRVGTKLWKHMSDGEY